MFRLVKKFGSILIRERPYFISTLACKKIIQALMAVSNGIQSMTDISVHHNKMFNTACIWPRGCSMTNKGEFIFTEYFYRSGKKLVLLNAQGKAEHTIKFANAHSACDVDCLNDTFVAVTSGETFSFGQCTGVSIVDLSTRSVIKFIDLPGDPYGISYDGSSLVCCVEDKDLHVISCKDYSITTIPNTTLPWGSYVSTLGDKIFVTKRNEHTVSCYLYDGTPVWDFKDRRMLQTPRGITVDDMENVFVVGEDSRNVLVISPDGTKCKEILSHANGLKIPIGIFLDKSRNQLLVANQSKEAYLYDISYFENSF